MYLFICLPPEAGNQVASNRRKGKEGQGGSRGGYVIKSFLKEKEHECETQQQRVKVIELDKRVSGYSRYSDIFILKISRL